MGVIFVPGGFFRFTVLNRVAPKRTLFLHLLECFLLSVAPLPSSLVTRGFAAKELLVASLRFEPSPGRLPAVTAHSDIVPFALSRWPRSVEVTHL